MLITARTSGQRSDGDGISLFAVDLGAADSGDAGIELHHYRTIDDRRASDIVLDGLRLPAAVLLGDEGGAWPSLARARDEGAAAICAEAVGGMRKVLADTVEYCKQRQRSERRSAASRCSSIAWWTCTWRSNSPPPQCIWRSSNSRHDTARARAVSAAKATIGRSAQFVGQQAVQLHGGMGMTEEPAIGHYLKRLTALQYEFGSTDHHVARYARLTTK